MTTRPPLSNLGPMSEPWARWQTDQTITNANAIERLGGDASNDGRINNSSMDLMTRQLNELHQRQSGIVSSPEVSTPSFSSGSSVTNVYIQIPQPTDVARIGWVAVQFTATSNSSLSTDVSGSFSADGNIFHRDSRTVPTDQFEPASWNGQKAITGYTGFTAEPGSGGLIQLTLEAGVIFDTGPRIITYSNIMATYQYGQAL